MYLSSSLLWALLLHTKWPSWWLMDRSATPCSATGRRIAGARSLLSLGHTASNLWSYLTQTRCTRCTRHRPTVSWAWQQQIRKFCTRQTTHNLCTETGTKSQKNNTKKFCCKKFGGWQNIPR